ISSVYSSGSFLSFNAAQPTPWRDTQVRIEGPVVADFQRLFMETWAKQKGDALPERNYFPTLKPAGEELVRAIGGASDEPVSLIYLTVISAINNAEKQIYLTNAYFVPDPQLLSALIDAAKRGVDVRLILPSETDSRLVLYAGRSHYEDLLE